MERETLHPVEREQTHTYFVIAHFHLTPPGVRRRSGVWCLGPASILVVFWGLFPPASPIVRFPKNPILDPFSRFRINQALLRGLGGSWEALRSLSISLD